MNRSGQAILESIGIMAFLSLSLSAGATIFYIGFAKAWIEHVAYESTLCLAQAQPQSVCKEQLQQKLILHLPFGELKKTKFQSNKKGFQTDIHWGFPGVEKCLVKESYLLTQKQINRASRWSRL